MGDDDAAHERNLAVAVGVRDLCEGRIEDGDVVTVETPGGGGYGSNKG